MYIFLIVEITIQEQSSYNNSTTHVVSRYSCSLTVLGSVPQVLLVSPSNRKFGAMFGELLGGERPDTGTAS